jgi:hypothetical protein
MPLFKVTVQSAVFVVAEDSGQASEKVYDIIENGDVDDDLEPVVKASKVNRLDITKKENDKCIVATEEIQEKSNVFTDYMTVEDFFKMKDAVA